jgi:hypothetical protein
MPLNKQRRKTPHAHATRASLLTLFNRDKLPRIYEMTAKYLPRPPLKRAKGFLF